MYHDRDHVFEFLIICKPLKELGILDQQTFVIARLGEALKGIFLQLRVG